ncbi:MAG: tyrosine-type recombinase/integrase [Nitrospira sp.]|nr:tyrosine-type recombinase/integrase [Nitrospira sp.]
MGDGEFGHPRVERESALRNLIERCHAEAEVKAFRFHDLRHIFATRLEQAGVDICTVPKLGRWKASPW